jgi:hypothetical protein
MLYDSYVISCFLVLFIALEEIYLRFLLWIFLVEVVESGDLFC